MADKSEKMTPNELSRLDVLLSSATGPAHIMLQARKRTGLRIGASVERGGWYVVAYAYSIGACGCPQGVASVRELFGPATQADAYAFVANLQRVPA